MKSPVRPELLAPAGNLQCLKAAISAGAGAVYFGGQAFNARKSADNFSLEDIREAVRLCRLYGVKTNFTLNTLIKESEWPELTAYLAEILPLGLDALIVQDLGVARCVLQMEEKLQLTHPPALHASTQLAVEDLSGALLLKEMGFSRVVLARELTLTEIRNITEQAGIETEVFIHGALCYSDSGRCLLSAFHGGRSGNRGACAQPCRLPYTLECPEEGLPPKTGYFMNLKDRWTVEHLQDLVKAGVASFKIEGRLKGEAYTAGVTRFYRELLDENSHPSQDAVERVTQLFNRGGFTEGYFTSKEQMIEPATPKNQGLRIGQVSHVQGNRVTVTTQKDLHPGDELEIVLSKAPGQEKGASGGRPPKRLSLRAAASMLNPGNPRILVFRTEEAVSVGDVVYRIVDLKLLDAIKEESSKLPQLPIYMDVSIRQNQETILTVWDEGTSVTMRGKAPEQAQKAPLTEETVRRQLTKTGDSRFYVENLLVNLEDGLFLTISDLNLLRREGLTAFEQQKMAGTAGDGGPDQSSDNIHPFPSANFIQRYQNQRIILGDKPTRGWALEWPKNLEEALAEMEELQKAGRDEIQFQLLPAMETFSTADKADFLKKAIAHGADVIPRLPRSGRDSRVDWIQREIEAWKAVGVTTFEASRLGQIRIIRERGCDVVAGPDFGIMNREAAGWLQALKVPYVISRELTREEAAELLESPLAIGLTESIVPYMVTEQCPYKEAYGCHKVPGGHRSILLDRKGEKMPCLSHCDLCYTEIFSEKPFRYRYRHQPKYQRKELFG